MKKAFKEAKEPLFVFLYFTTVFSLSCYLTYLTSWNFGIFMFGFFGLSLFLLPKVFKPKNTIPVRVSAYSKRQLLTDRVRKIWLFLLIIFTLQILKNMIKLLAKRCFCAGFEKNNKTSVKQQ